MRKTTMTVAAFLAVAAYSFAAEAPKNAGNSVTIGKDKTSATIQVAFKQGTYAAFVEEEGVTLTGAIGEEALADVKNFVIPEAGATVTFTVEIDEPAGEKGQAVTIKYQPKDPDYLKKYQPQINLLVTEANDLNTMLDGGESEALKKMRADLLTEASELQQKVNSIESYETYLDKGKVPAIDSELATLTQKVDASIANEEQFEAALEAYNEDASIDDLEKAYQTALERTDIDEDTKEEIKKTYEAAVEAYDSFLDDLKEAYENGKAGDIYPNDDAIDEAIDNLQEIIDSATAGIVSGNLIDLYYNRTNMAIAGLQDCYNDAANELYEQLVDAEDAKTYDDLYKQALSEMQPALKKIADAKKANEELHEANLALEDPADAELKDWYDWDLPWDEAYGWGDDLDVSTHEFNNIADKYINGDEDEEFVGIGDKNDPEVGTLRGNYKKALKDIADFNSDVINPEADEEDQVTVAEALKKAMADADTDGEGTKISTYFTGKNKELFDLAEKSTSILKGIEDDVEEANAGHTITDDIVATLAASEGLDEAKATLVEDLKEYREYDDNRLALNNLKASLGEKKSAAEKLSKVTTAKFDTKGITDAIDELLADAKESYTVDGSDEVDERDYVLDTDAITTAIENYETRTTEAATHYNNVTASLDAYGAEINGKAAEGEEGKEGYKPEIKAWSKVVTNDKVTVDGTAKGQTYAKAKAEQDEKVDEVKGELKDMMDATYNEEVYDDRDEFEEDFVASLTDLDNLKKDQVTGATTRIQELKAAYTAELVENWQKATDEQARVDAIAESYRRVEEIQDMLDNLDDDFDYDTYGKGQAEALKQKKTDLQKELNDLNDAIYAVENDKGMTAKDAIAQIKDVQDELDKVAAAANDTSFEEEAAQMAAAYLGAMEDLDDLIDKMDGKQKKDPKDHPIYDEETGDPVWETGYEPISELLDPQIGGFLDEEIADIKGDILEYRMAIENAPSVPNVLAAKSDKNPDGQDLEKKIKDLKTTVNNLRGELAKNESENEAAKQKWDEFLAKYKEIPAEEEGEDPTYQSVQDLINAAETAIEEVCGADAEEFFLDQLNGAENKKSLQAQFDKIVDNAKQQYETKKKNAKAPKTGNKDWTKVNDKYTAAIFNESAFEKRVNALVEQIDALVEAAALNEKAYALQAEAYEATKKLWDDVFMEVNAANENGQATAEAFSKAIDDLNDIKPEIPKYKDGYDEEVKDGDKVKTEHTDGYEDAYPKGESVKFDGDLAKINALSGKIAEIRQGWKNDYDKAVAQDNADLKDEFDAAWEALYIAYYGTNIGQTHQDGAVDVVTKLSKLSYADHVTDKWSYSYLYGDWQWYTIQEIVTGDHSLYSFADEISNLRKEAQEDFTGLEAGKVWERSDEFMDRVQGMTEAILKLADAYSKAVNNQAWTTYLNGSQDASGNYIPGKDAVESMLEGAKKDLQDHLGLEDVYAEDEEGEDDLALTNALNAFKNADQMGAEEIYDWAVSNEGERDFAYTLDNEILPAFAELPGLLEASVEATVTDAWDDMYDQIDQKQEKADIAKFWGSETPWSLSGEWVKGFYNDAYDNDDPEAEDPDQVDRLAAADAIFYTAVDEDGDEIDIFDRYDAAKELFDAETETRYFDEDGNWTVPNGDDVEDYVAVIHSNVYWEAWDKNSSYVNANEMKAELQQALDEAQDFVEPLLVSLDEVLVTAYNDLEDRLDNWTYGYNEDKKEEFLDDIEDFKEKALLKEYEALGIELGELDKRHGVDDEKVINKEVHDKLLGFVADNELIYNDYDYGYIVPVVDAEGEPVLGEDEKQIEDHQPIFDEDGNETGDYEKATAEETRDRYVELEKAIGKYKAEIDEEGKAAEGLIAGLIDDVKDAYAELEQQVEDSEYEAVQNSFADALEKIEEAIDEFTKKVEGEGTAVALNWENDRDIANMILNSIAEVSEEIDAFEEQIATLTDEIDALQARLDEANEAAAAYKYQKERKEGDKDANGDPVEPWTIGEDEDEVEFWNFREYRYAIISAGLTTAQNKVDELTPENIEIISDGLPAIFEHQISNFEKNFSWYNARKYTDYIAEELLGPTNADLNFNPDKLILKSENIDDLNDELEAAGDALNAIKNFNNNIYRYGEYEYDIEGNPIDEDDETVTEELDYYTEAYEDVMDALAQVEADILDVAGKIVTKGAINGEEVSSKDIETIMELILEEIDPETLTEAQRTAADVDGNNKYTVADLIQIQNAYIYGDYAGAAPIALELRAKAREAAKANYYSNGTLGMDIATSEIAVNLEKAKSYAAIQMDVTLPAGVELTEAAFAGNSDAVGAAFNKIAANTWRVLLSATDGSSVNASEAILKLALAGEGAGTVKIDNAIGATAKGKDFVIGGVSGEYTIATGIAATEVKADSDGTIFGANGVLRKQLEKGVNIIKTAGGAVKKIFVK